MDWAEWATVAFAGIAAIAGVDSMVGSRHQRRSDGERDGRLVERWGEEDERWGQQTDRWASQDSLTRDADGHEWQLRCDDAITWVAKNVGALPLVSVQLAIWWGSRQHFANKNFVEVGEEIWVTIDGAAAAQEAAGMSQRNYWARQQILDARAEMRWGDGEQSFRALLKGSGQPLRP